MIFELLVFVLGLALTILGANWLIDGATSIARRFGISDLVVGLLIVSIGTSSPELIVTLLSSLKGQPDLAIGNILGSNIANILLILGLSSVIRPIPLEGSTLWKEIPFGFLAALALGVMVNDILFDVSASNNYLSRADGIVLLLFMAIFFVYSFEMMRNTTQHTSSSPKYSLVVAFLWVIVGVSGLYFGGELLLRGALKMAEYAGLSPRVIGLTIVAVGTSIPELVTSLVAVAKKKTEILVGNLVGSNIFNIFLILGVSATIHEIPFAQEANFDVITLLLTTVLFFFFGLFFGYKVITRVEGAIMLAMYGTYITLLMFI